MKKSIFVLFVLIIVLLDGCVNIPAAASVTSSISPSTAMATTTPIPPATPAPTFSPFPTPSASVFNAEEIQKNRIESRKDYIKLDYKKYARNPDTYPDQKVYFKGKIIQSIEKGKHYSFRVAVNNSYNQIVWVDYSAWPEDPRILENDKVTIYATCNGLYTYESTGAGQITIPTFIGHDVVIQ